MPNVFVSTYRKYNDGDLTGRWLDLEDYDSKEEFLEACHELHNDEDDPELMFQDHEGIPKDFITESHIDEGFWDYMNCSADDGAKEAYMACFGDWDERQFNERYRGEYDGWTKMAEELVDELGYLDEIPEDLRYYFDYEAYARDLRLGGDMCEDNNHFFWNR